MVDLSPRFGATIGDATESWEEMGSAVAGLWLHAVLVSMGSANSKQETVLILQCFIRTI